MASQSGVVGYPTGHLLGTFRYVEFLHILAVAKNGGGRLPLSR